MKNDAVLTTSTTEKAEEGFVSRAEYDALKRENAELNQKLDFLMGQLHLAKKKMFGASSEQAAEQLLGQLSFLFNEAEAWTPREEKASETTAVAAHTRQKRSSDLDEVLPEGVAVEVVEHGIPEAERVCDACGTVMEQIGKEVRHTLVLRPATATIREDVYYTYACRKCSVEATETPILKTERIPPVISGSYASPEAIAHIMVQKFVMASPLYRQEQELNRSGIQLSRQTMSNWILRAADDWLTPIYEEMKKRLVKEKVLHADETTLQVLKEPGKSAQSKSYMWLYRTGKYTSQPMILVGFMESGAVCTILSTISTLTAFLFCAVPVINPLALHNAGDWGDAVPRTALRCIKFSLIFLALFFQRCHFHPENPSLRVYSDASTALPSLRTLAISGIGFASNSSSSVRGV